MDAGPIQLRLAAALTATALLAAACSSSVSGHGAGSPVASSPSTPHSSTSLPTVTPPSTATATRTHPAPRLRGGFRVDDLTFVGDEGWALGTVPCASGRCAALAHSSDDGLTWSRMSARPPVHVDHIRFATDRIGYAFGQSALFVTRDGGRTWHRQSGGADALETLSGNVIRVVDQGGCPPGCKYSVLLSSIGGTSWRAVTLPGSQGDTATVQLVRNGRVSAIETLGRQAGGGFAYGVLFTSRNNGATWTRRGEPCPQGANGEIDSTRLASAPDGSITVLCTPHSENGWQFTVTSTDGGATFHTGYRRALGAAPISALGAASASTILVSSDDTYRSTDGGRHFSRVSATNRSSVGRVRGMGFASSAVGHAMSLDGRTIWTTTDAGRTWRAATVR